MAYLGRKGAPAPLTSADIPDSSITSAKIVDGTIVDGDVASNAAIAGSKVGITEFDDDKIQTNIALLAFKTAVNGSLAKYDLQDQIIDEYVNETGVNTGDCTNQNFLTGSYNGRTIANTPPTGGDESTYSTYNVHKFDNHAATETFVVAAAGNVDILVVGGGGSGAASYGGGGGAGGLVFMEDHALTANTYNAVVGDGGQAHSGSAREGYVGEDTTWAINGGSTIFTAKGGGAGGEADNDSAGDGGSGGGSGYIVAAGGATTQAGTSQGVTPDVSIGFAGGSGHGTSTYSTGGGGGAGEAGANGNSSYRDGGDGGEGLDYSAKFGTGFGDSGWFAGGGGGEAPTSAGACTPNASAPHHANWRDNGGRGGGGAGQEWLCDAPWVSVSAAGTDGTGGGSGGGQNLGIGKGGSGIILVRYPTAQSWLAISSTPSDMTLQSSDTTAEAAPTKADIVMLVEDVGSGVASLDTSSGNLKAWVSMYETGGTKTWTQVPLVDEGDWGTNKRILSAHDVTLTGTSGTQMAYKITTHSSSAVYDTKIHATSMGWR